LGDKDLFLFLGGRSNDFTGYVAGKNPILVFDDILQEKLNWKKGTLLKVFGHEKFTVDMKYSPQTTMYPTNSIILTNNYRLFGQVQHQNLEVRFTRLPLRDRVN